MFLIVGTIRLPAENLKGAKAQMEAMVAGSRAEPGCIFYNFAEDLFVPGLIHISEAWKDMAAITAHGTAEHMKTWRAAAASLGIGERNIKRYEIAGEPTAL